MRFWNMTPDVNAPGDGVLDIEGPIATDKFWGDETSSREFRQALAGMGNVTVHINSPGGDVMAGAEIYSALKEHSLSGKGRVKVIITALAASAASVVAMAGDEVLISPVAYMMIHNPWTCTMGDAKEMRKAAKTLDEIADGLIGTYQTRTGKTRDELKKMLDNETWMSAQKAVEEGFADAIYGGEIRAAAFAGASMLTRETPESVREMCARWDQAKRNAKKAEEGPEEDPDEENPNEPEEPDEEDSENRGAHGADQPANAPDQTEPEEENPNEPEEPDEEDSENRGAHGADQPANAPDQTEPEEENPNDPEEDPEETENRTRGEEDPDEEPEEPEDETEEDPDEDEPENRARNDEEDPEETEEEPEEDPDEEPDETDEDPEEDARDAIRQAAEDALRALKADEDSIRDAIRREAEKIMKGETP